jgi:malonate transporter
LADIVSLLLPFFGLILIGYIAARITKQPAEALGWLNTFIIYAALPALFFKLVSRTPFEDLTRIDFIATDLAATYSIFIALFVIGRWIRGNSLADCTIQSFAGAYGNIGYMGPGLALIALGEGRRCRWR